MKTMKKISLVVALCTPLLIVGCDGQGMTMTQNPNGEICIDMDNPNGGPNSLGQGGEQGMGGGYDDPYGQGNQGGYGQGGQDGQGDPYGQDQYGQGGNGQEWPEDNGQYGPSTGQESGNPPAPGNGQDPGPRTDLDPPRGPITKNAELKELKDKYGIELGGNYSDKDIVKALTSARQYLPNETKNLKINYFIGKKPSEIGVEGQALIPTTAEEAEEGTIIELFNDKLHVTLHEITHHITLFPVNKRAIQVADETFAKVPGFPNSTPKEYIPSDYAMTCKDEYTAETFSFLRTMEKGIDGEEPPLSGFNPPEDFRKVARKLYATP